MVEIIAFCGLDCVKCPAYIATKANDEEGLRETAKLWSEQLGIDITAEGCVCDGCQPLPSGRHGGYCGDCPMRSCAMERGYGRCEECPDYRCDLLVRFYGETEK